jgi:ribosomal protein S18 acetylase RimI-like enzyme
MMTSPIKTATASDEEHVIAVVVLALSADPLTRWVYPDPHQYLTHYPNAVRALAGKACEQGTSYYIDGYAGAPLWLAPGVQPDEDALIALIKRSVSKVQEDVLVVLEQMRSYHPHEPHWYLPLIGVDPAHQHQGCGSALMRHALMPCDRDHKLAYLESTSPASVRLYERHGFEVLGTIQVGTSPPIFPMVRTPR